jgi:hypothetical protein
VPGNIKKVLFSKINVQHLLATAMSFVRNLWGALPHRAASYGSNAINMAITAPKRPLTLFPVTLQQRFQSTFQFDPAVTATTGEGEDPKDIVSY